MPDIDDGKTTLWYYRLGGAEFGPVLTNRLRQLARKGELVAEDLVRRGKMGEWVEAGTIEGLPVKPRAKPVAAPPRPAIPEPVEYDYGGSYWQSVVYWYYDTLQAIVERFWIIRRVGAILALVAVTAVLIRLSLTIDLDRFNKEPPPDPYTKFTALYDELKEKRESGAKDDAWNELTERGRREIEPLVATLSKDASSTNRVAQMLLWAGRDCLTKMFDDAREEPSRTEEKFNEYMQNVDRLRKDQPIYGGNLGATHLYDHIIPLMRAKQKVGSTTFLIWGAIAVTNIGVLTWLIRRWRQG